MKFAVSFPEDGAIRYAYCTDDSTDTFRVVSDKIVAPEQNTETAIDFVPLFQKEDIQKNFSVNF